MHPKKSQTSIFVIVGLIMFIAVILGFFLYTKVKTAKIEEETKTTAELSFQAKEVEKFVNDCIRKEAFEGLKTLGKTGGYFDVPSLINFQGTSLWYLEQANVQPFLNQTQERLIDYINSNVPICVESGNLSKYGFFIQKEQIKTFMEFGSNDIAIKVVYPIKISKAKFSKDFSDFFNTFDIRYRSTFEAAAEVNERLFDFDFDIREPLKKTDYIKELGFDIAYAQPEPSILTFTITDKESRTPENQLYTFSFAAKFGNSSLKKITDLQNNSATNPTFLAYTIYSVDKKAQLDIAEDTTISLNGTDVSFISVQQTYPDEVTTKDVPVYKQNDQVLQKQDIKYVIENPVYTFEPSGLLFNEYEKLTIYYDDETKDDKGVGILMGKKGFWIPIPSTDDLEEKNVFANILGFTEFTAIYCASQTVKQTIAEHVFEPTTTCYVSLAITVLAIVVAVVAIVGVIAAAVASTGGALGASTAIVAGTGASGLSGFVSSVGASVINGLSVLGVSVTTASLTVGTLVVGLSVLSTAATILGATTDIFYDHSPDQCETFYPTCDQTITVDKQEDDGEGECVPDGSTTVSAGQTVTLCAQVEKCNIVQKYICLPCSVKCTASFT